MSNNFDEKSTRKPIEEATEESTKKSAKKSTKKPAKKSAKKKYNYVTKTLTLPDGTRKYVYGKTKAEAEQKVAELRAEIAGGVVVNDETTFGEMTKVWLENYKAPFVRESTLNNLRSKINTHLMPYLATIPIKEITSLQIQSVVVRMVEKNFTGVYETANIIKSVLNLAVDSGCIMKSPYPKSLKLRAERGKTPKQVLSRELEAKISEKLPPLSRERLFFQCGIHLGCRRGEIFGLAWENIDMENGIIYIRQQIVFDKQGRANVDAVLKTNAGRRELPISATLRKELELWGEWYGTEGLLFFAPALGNLSGTGSYRFWNHIRKICKEYDPEYAKHFTPHILRHTYITRLFEAGLDLKEIQTLAGHKDVRMTLSVYTHFDKDSRQASTFSKVRSALDGCPSDTPEPTAEEAPKRNPNVIQMPFPKAVNFR